MIKLADPRLVTLADIPWVMALAEQRYPEFDVVSSMAWLASIIQDPQVMACHNEHAVGIASWTSLPWQPRERRGMVFFLFSDGRTVGAAITLLDFMLKWLSSEGCVESGIDGDSTTDLSAFVRKLGGEIGPPQCIVRHQ